MDIASFVAVTGVYAALPAAGLALGSIVAAAVVLFLAFKLIGLGADFLRGVLPAVAPAVGSSLGRAAGPTSRPRPLTSG